MTTELYAMCRALAPARSAEELLYIAIRKLTEASTLNFENMGAGFLVVAERNLLRLSVAHNLADPLLTLCAEVPVGSCMCGRAAATGEIQHLACGSRNHEQCFDGLKPHGHYNVPIMLDGSVVSVIALYLKPGAEHSERRIEFLREAAAIIGEFLGSLKRIETLEASNAALKKALDQEHEIRKSLELSLDCLEVSLLPLEKPQVSEKRIPPPAKIISRKVKLRKALPE